MFQLTKEEFEKMKSDLIFQNGTSSWGGTRKLPYAFTEQGLAMLSGVLNSDTAIEVNIAIMRAFVAVRQLITTSPTNRLDSLEQEVQTSKPISKKSSPTRTTSTKTLVSSSNSSTGLLLKCNLPNGSPISPVTR